VDFGFSERYDAPEEPSSCPSFLSSLAYGTPEYLSPERAAGHMHDTRKADVWSLGVTFFEFLFNRTPFEHDRAVGDKGDKEDNTVMAGGSARADKAAMDAYWSRTMKGKWHGAEGSKLRTRMSAGLEAMLRRMISPNADVRYTSTQVVKDPYWTDSVVSKPKSAKVAGTIPAVNVDSATPARSSGSLSSVVRTVLGNKQNVMGAGKSVGPTGGQTEQKLVISPGGAKGDGKENAVPRSPRSVNTGASASTTTPAKLRKERSGARLVKTSAVAKPDESGKFPSYRWDPCMDLLTTNFDS
jgi:serine/threonine protein kinase